MYAYVCTVDARTHPHISAHNFLNIRPIFNPKKVFESLDPQGFLTTSTIHVDTVDTRQGSANALNAIYVNTVDIKHIQVFLPIKIVLLQFWSMSDSVFLSNFAALF